MVRPAQTAIHYYVDNTLLGNMVGALRQARSWATLWKRAAKKGYRERWAAQATGYWIGEWANAAEQRDVLQAENDKLRAELASRDERRCETCRHLECGAGNCFICELLTLHVAAETTGTFSCSLWQAREHQHRGKRVVPPSCPAELRETQAKLADVVASNKLFSDCIRRAGVAYRKAHPERPDGGWPDGAKAFVWWVESMQAELERLRAELASRDERRCDTCRHFHAGTYTCAGQWSALKCAIEGFSNWEARDERDD